MHTLGFCEKELNIVALTLFPEVNLGPGVSRQGSGVLIAAPEHRFIAWKAIPLLAGNLAAATANALGSIIKDRVFHHLNHLLCLCKENLIFWNARVCVADVRRELVSGIAGCNPLKAEMPGDTDNFHLLTVHIQRLHAHSD